MVNFRLKFLLLLLFGSVGSLFAQKPSIVSRYLNSLVSDTNTISKPQLLIYPTVGYAPETRWQFGLSGLYVYYAARDTLNRLSSINPIAFYTLEHQYGIWIDHTLYANNNNWFIQGRLRYQHFPLYYYGIGPKTEAEHPVQVDAREIMIRERVLRKFAPNMYAGLHADFQRHSQLVFKTDERTVMPKPAGAKGSLNLAFGLGVMLDSRENALNARKGAFSELAILRYDNFWGSDFSYTSLISDTRVYASINSRDVLAFQLLGQLNEGDIPFNQLALLGNESTMRGYYTGRFRDNNMLSIQAEYRLLPLPLGFTNRLGAVAFAGSGTVFDRVDELDITHLKWSGGGGLRLLLFPKKDIYTRFDVAFTDEGHGFYIFIGEAF